MTTNTKSIFFDPTRVNQPLVRVQEGEKWLFEEEQSRLKQIFRTLIENQTETLRVARQESHNRVADRRARTEAIEKWSGGSNMLAIFGKRGSGKSSVLLSLKDMLMYKELSADFKPEKDRDTLGFLPIWLNPELFMERPLAVVFLAKMYLMFKDWFEEECSQGTGKHESRQRRLHSAFQNIQRAFEGVRQGEIKDFSLQNLLLTSEASSLQTDVFELIELMLEVKGCEHGKLVLLIDDFDLQEEMVPKHLDDWKLFLNLPNVIVVLATAHEELEELLVESRMKDRIELIRAGAANAMKILSPGRPDIIFPGMPWLEKRELYERAHASLLKVVGPNRRVYINPNKARLSDTITVLNDHGVKDVDYSVEEFLTHFTRASIGMHFFIWEEKHRRRKKFDIIIDAWRDSSLREQVIAMAQLREGLKRPLLDANFSHSEIRRFEKALPTMAKRYQFAANAVRWIVIDRNALGVKSLRDFCEGELRTEFRSTWQAFLFLNYMWVLLGDADEVQDVSINFLEVERESDALYWGEARIDMFRRLRGGELLNPSVSPVAKRSTFVAELMASEFYRSDEKAEWRPQLLRAKLAVNPINAIHRLVLGEGNALSPNSNFRTKADWFDDAEIKDLQERYKDWLIEANNSTVWKYVRESLANPFFFSSLMTQFPKGSHLRVSGVSGFFERVEAELIDNVIHVFELRFGQSGGEESKLLAGIKEVFESHPLRSISNEWLSKSVKDALDFNDEDKRQSEQQYSSIKDWKRFITYLYKNRDEFLPTVWKEPEDPGNAALALKSNVVRIQNYLNREVHKQPGGNAQPNFGDLEVAKGLTEELKLVEAATKVYDVVEAYIKYCEQTVKDLEFKIQEAEVK